MAGYDGSLKFDTEISEKGFNSGITKLGSLAKGGMTVLAGAIGSVTAALGAGAVAGMKYNASIETYQTSFEVMTGSAEKAAEVVERLKKVGAETPFELPELADTTQLLMNYGLTADEAMDKMMMLGDISQGSADKMSRIAMAYGQMSSAGKVQLEDVKQMIEAGFNPLQEISESTGESMSSLYDRISKGTLSVDEITASMERATSAGGKYYQSMQKQSQTFSGMISTLKDNAQQLLGDVVQPISDNMVSTLLPAAIDAIDQMSNAFQSQGVDGLIQAGSQVVTNLVNGISSALPELMATAGNIVLALGQGIVSALPSLGMAAMQILTTLLSSIATGGVGLNEGILIVTNLANGISQQLPILIQSAGEAFATLLRVFINNAPQMITAGVSLILSLANGISQQLPTLIPLGLSAVLSVVEGIAGNLPQILQSGIQMVQNIAAGIASSLPEILSKGSEIIGQLLAGIISKVPDLIGAIPGIVRQIWNAFTNVNWGEIGHNIIAGIGRGIAGAVGGLVDAAVSAAKSAFNAIKDFLGINSPSRLMRDQVGKYMALGMGVGFEKNIPDADMNKGVERMIAGMKKTTARITLSPATTAGAMSAFSGRSRSSERAEVQELTNAVRQLMRYADRPIEARFDVDGRNMAKVIAKPVRSEIEKIDKSDNRMKGKR